MSGVYGPPQGPDRSEQNPYQHPPLPGYPGAAGSPYGAPPAYGYAAPGYGPPPSFWEPVRSETDPGIDRPWYGIGLIPAYVRFWKKYATFSGRASRGEYWWAYLANMIVIVPLYVVFIAVTVATQEPCPEYSTYSSYSCSDSIPPAGGVVMAVVAGYLLAAFVPMLAVAWRRLHDTGRSGGFYFIGCIPWVGGIILIVLLAARSSLEGARYDPPAYGPYGAQPYDAPNPYGQPPYGQPPYGGYPR